ncbi:MAG: hypothetical protein WCS69_15830 [Ignavibacteriaceae bacterium]|jgi:hypothetical protein
MEINFSKKEYVALLDMLEIAEWIMNSFKIEIDDENSVYQKLEQKIYSFAKKMGCEELIEYDDTLQEYFPTRELDDTSPAMEFINEYDNETFWDELIERLVERDLEMQVGSKNYKRMTIEEMFSKEAPIEEKYSLEFDKNGVKNLYLKEPAKEVKVFRIN